MKHILKHIIVAIFIMASSFVVFPAATANAAACDGQTSIFPRWYDDLCSSTNKGQIMSPREFNGAKTAEGTADNFGKWAGVIAMNIVKILMLVVGYVSLGFIIWGGFKYMISGDNSSGTVAARKTILNAVIGLILSIASIAIINFVTKAIVA